MVKFEMIKLPFETIQIFLLSTVWAQVFVRALLRFGVGFLLGASKLDRLD